jgi:hypothetical protein
MDKDRPCHWHFIHVHYHLDRHRSDPGYRGEKPATQRPIPSSAEVWPIHVIQYTLHV